MGCVNQDRGIQEEQAHPECPGLASVDSWVCGCVARRRVGAGYTDLDIRGASLRWMSSPGGTGSLQREDNTCP